MPSSSSPCWPVWYVCLPIELLPSRGGPSNFLVEEQQQAESIPSSSASYPHPRPPSLTSILY